MGFVIFGILLQCPCTCIVKIGILFINFIIICFVFVPLYGLSHYVLAVFTFGFG